jgi:hypothetical protein
VLTGGLNPVDCFRSPTPGLRSAAVTVPEQDPEAAAYYTLGSVFAVDAGNNILERTISLDLLSLDTSVNSRPIVLREITSSRKL